MRKTHLFIEVNGEWKELDLYEDIVIPITLKVMDIRNFGSKSASYSSDITIPHTPNNSRIFGIVEELNAYNATFEFCKNYAAYIETDGLVTFRGQFRLKKVFKQRGGDYSYYVGCLFSDSKNFIDKLGNQTLIDNDNPEDDLSFSEYSISASNFTLNEMRNRLTQMNSNAQDFGFTFIDKNNKANQNFSAAGLMEWSSNELTPYLFVREILDKMMEQTGYSYVSEFLSKSSYTNNFRWADTIGQFNIKNMIYPYSNNNTQLSTLNNPENLTVTQNTNASGLFFGYDIFPTNASLYTTLEFMDLTTNPDTFTYSKPQNTQYQILNWQPSKDGKYVINITLPFKMALIFAYYYFASAVEGWQQVKYTYNTASVNNYTYPLEVVFNLCTKRNGTEIVLHEQSITWQLTSGTLSKIGTEHWGNNYSVSVLSKDDWTGTYTVNNLEVLLKSTDVLYFKIYSVVPYTDNGTNAFYCTSEELGANTRLSGAPRVYSTGQDVGTEIMSFVQINEFAELQDFDPTVVLNKKTKKLDFLRSLTRMFNLFIEDVSCKKNYKDGTYYPPNTLRIEPYQIYYTPDIQTGSNIHNWTDKIDWDDVEYRREEDILYVTQKFSKQHNNDYFTSEYNNTYKTPFGDYIHEGEFCTDDTVNEIDVNFGAFECGLVNDQTVTAQVPKIFTLNNKGEVDTKKEYSDSIFFLWFNDMYNQTGLESSFFQVRSSVTPNNSILLTNYYCADNFNEGYGNATADINFGIQNDYLQQLNGENPPENTLFNAFYKKQYEALTAPDSRIMVANAYLTAFDIATLQLSDTIIIGDNKWHILEVKEWKNEKEPCEVQLIKILPEETINTSIRMKSLRPVENVPALEISEINFEELISKE